MQRKMNKKCGSRYVGVDTVSSIRVFALNCMFWSVIEVGESIKKMLHFVQREVGVEVDQR